jgi:hypothetical protein
MEVWTLQTKIGDRWALITWKYTKEKMDEYLQFHRPRYAFRVAPMSTDDSRAMYSNPE